MNLPGPRMGRMPLLALRRRASFTGAYDAIPSIVAAYSTRRLRSAYTGPLLRLVADRVGYPEQDINATANGDLDTAAVTSFLAGDTGYITTWYDQSGGARNVTQATLASMPLYVASGQNSLPVLRFDGSNDRLLTNSSLAARSEESFLAVVKFSALKESGLVSAVASVGAWVVRQRSYGAGWARGGGGAGRGGQLGD